MIKTRLVLSVIIPVAILLSGCSIVTNPPPSTTPHQSPPASGVSKRGQITLGQFDLPTPSPSASVVPFNSGYLDWEDVQIIINLAGNESTISTQCRSELHQAERVEAADIGSSIASAGQLDPNSRVSLCLQNAQCVAYGYDHYDGATPLPVFAPSASCQTEIANAFYSAENNALASSNPYNRQIAKQADYDVHPPVAPNCDTSDGVQNEFHQYVKWICDRTIAQPSL